MLRTEGDGSTLLLHRFVREETPTGFLAGDDARQEVADTAAGLAATLDETGGADGVGLAHCLSPLLDRLEYSRKEVLGYYI